MISAPGTDESEIESASSEIQYVSKIWFAYLALCPATAPALSKQLRRRPPQRPRLHAFIDSIAAMEVSSGCSHSAFVPESNVLAGHIGLLQRVRCLAHGQSGHRFLFRYRPGGTRGICIHLVLVYFACMADMSFVATNGSAGAYAVSRKPGCLDKGPGRVGTFILPPDQGEMASGASFLARY